MRERDEKNHGNRPCGAGLSGVQHETTHGRHAGDLLHHNFVLQSVDGETAKSPAGGGLLNLEFGESLHVSGAMCNRFFGRGNYATAC